MEPNAIKLKLKDGNLEANGRLADMSDLIKELTALGGDAEIPLNDVSSAVMKKVIEFCQLNKYKAPEIPKVNGNELNKILDAENMKFIEANSSFKDLDLFRAALTLRIPSLVQAISAAFAAKVFFKKNDIAAYKAKRDEFKIKEITHEDSDKIAEEFPLLNK